MLEIIWNVNIKQISKGYKFNINAKDAKELFVMIVEIKNRKYLSIIHIDC